MFNRTWLLQPTSPTAEPLWVSTKTRTTTDLVTSCVVTLIVCVWTAVHLNVPSYEERTTSSGWYKQARKRLKWMLSALFAPEVVLWMALDQFLEARAVALELAKIAAVEKRHAESQQSQRPQSSPSHSPDVPSSQMNAVNDEESQLQSHGHPGATIDFRKEPATHQDNGQNTFDIEQKQITPSSENVIKSENENSLDKLPSVTFEEWVAAADYAEMQYRRRHELRISRLLRIAQDWLSKNTTYLSNMHAALTRASSKFLSPIWDPVKQRIAKGYDFCFPPGLEKAFYIVMGGYEVDLPSSEVSSDSFRAVTGKPVRSGGIKFVLFNGQRRAVILGNRWTLTSKGATSLAWMGLLPNMRPEEIKDKSKADSLAKTLVCLQASWMILQCISRKAQGLPVTLLEVNTVMHVVCALLMYLFWLHKAQGVTEPTLVPLDPRLKKLLDCEIQVVPQPEGTADTLLWKAGHGITNYQPTRNTIVINMDGKLWLRLKPQSHRYKGTKFSCIAKAPSKEDIDGLCEFLVERDVFWTEGLQGIESNLSIEGDTFGQYASNLPTGWGQLAEGMNIASSVGFLIATVVTALYGGVHVIPWNGHFATHLERILWRASGILIVSGGLLWLICWYSIELFSSSYYRNRLLYIPNPFSFFIPIAQFLFSLLDVTFCLMLIILIILYILARVYMVAEAFVSLRSLPVGAYEVVSWADMIPHF